MIRMKTACKFARGFRQLFFLAFALSFVVCTPIFAKPPLTLQYNDEVLSLTNEPFIQNDRTMVGMSEIFTLLGAEVDWFGETKTIIASRDGTTIKLTIGSDMAVVGGVETTLDVAPLIVDGVTFVPIGFVGKALGNEVSYESAENRVSIIDMAKPVEPDESAEAAKPAAVAPVAIPADEKQLATDSESALPVLTFDDAADKAIKNNSSLKKLSDALTLIEKKRSDMRATYGVMQGAGVVDDTMFTMLNAMVVLNATIADNPNTKVILEDATKMAVKGSFNSIAALQLDLKLLEQSFMVTEEEVAMKQKLLDAGMESKSNVDALILAKNQQQKSIDNLRLSIQSEKTSLNSLMGVDVNMDYQVEENPAYKPLGNFDIDTYVLSKLSSNPALESKRLAVKSAEAAMWTISATNPKSPEEVENDVTNAKRDLADAQKKQDSTIRETYFNILQLESMQETYKLNVQKAYKDYDELAVQLEVGNITVFTLKQGKLAILKAETDLAKGYLTLDTLRFTFNHPYLLIMG